MNETTTRQWKQGGNAEVTFGADGSISAVSRGAGDWSCGYSSTSRTVNFGPGQSAGSCAPVPAAQCARPTVGYQPYLQQATGLQYGQPAAMPGVPQGSVMQQQLMPAMTGSPYNGPPPTYWQSEKKHKKWL